MPLPSVRYLYDRVIEHFPEGMGGDYVAREASSEAKASGMRCPVVGGRRVIVIAGERRIRGHQWARSGYADAEHRSKSRNHSQ
jgi:hypothetical protein